MRARAPRAISPGRSSCRTRRAPLQEGTEFGLETGERGIEQLAARYDNDVETSSRLVVAEQLAHATLGPVSNHGGPKFTGSCDAQPWVGMPGCVHKHGHQAPMILAPRIVDSGVFAPFSDVIHGAKGVGAAH